MNILVVGLSHKTAPVAIRERVAFEPTDMQGPLHRLLALPAIAEAVIVSTCNRVEIYATSRDTENAISQIKRYLSETHALDSAELDKHLYDYQGSDAIHHVFGLPPASTQWSSASRRFSDRSKRLMATPVSLKQSA